MEKKGKRFLIITSILMILGGAVGFVNGVIAVLGAGALAAMIGETASFGRLMLGSIFVWGSGLAGIMAGVGGIKRAARPGRATARLVQCALAAALSVLGNLLTVSGGGEINALSLITGLALPALLLAGYRAAAK